MRTLIFTFLLIAVTSFAAPQPTTYLNAWTTNKSVLPVFGDNNLAIQNRISGPGGFTNWNFFGIGPNTVARLKDATNIANAIVSSSQVWTQDSGFIFPNGTSLNDSTAGIVIRTNDGSLFLGKNEYLDTPINVPYPLISYQGILASNDVNQFQFDFAVFDDPDDYNLYSVFNATVNADFNGIPRASASIALSTKDTNSPSAYSLRFTSQPNTNSRPIRWRIGSSDLFWFGGDGSLTLNGILSAVNQTNSGTLDVTGDATFYSDLFIKGGLGATGGGTLAGGFKITDLTANRLLTLDGSKTIASSAYSDADIAALQAATNGAFIRTQTGTGNATTLTNSFFVVGSSNFYQQFKTTTTNTGGILDQRVPIGWFQFANNQVNGTDPHQDVQTVFGYNFTGSGGQANTNEGSFGYVFESDWQNFNNLIQSEWYLSYQFPYTNFSIRPLGFNFQRSTNTAPGSVLTGSSINGNITADSFSFQDRFQATAPWNITMDTAGKNATVTEYGQHFISGNYLNQAILTIGGTDGSANGFLIVKNSSGAGGEITMSGTTMLFDQTSGVTRFRFSNLGPLEVDGLHTNAAAMNTAGGVTNYSNQGTYGNVEIGSLGAATSTILSNSSSAATFSIQTSNSLRSKIFQSGTAVLIGSSAASSVSDVFEILNGTTSYQFDLNANNGFTINNNGFTFGISASSSLNSLTSNSKPIAMAVGSETARITSTNVLIGTTAGLAKLHITNSNVQVGLRVDTIASNDIAVFYRGTTLVGGVSSNGIYSLVSNLVAPTAITFPNSTVNWTNPLNCNIELYIDNTAVTGTAIKKNGTQIFGGLSNDVTMHLQPGEFFSETYSVGTPSATFSPF